MDKRIEVYRVVQGEVVFDVDSDKETLWASEEQISHLFDVDRSVINRHIRNIYKSGELDESSTCAKNAQVRMEGNRKVTRTVRSYNLDMIISIGYRVNSKKATDFRIWATKVLHRYVVDGAAINDHRLKELDARKLHELENALGIVKRLVATNELSADEAGGVLEVISKYNSSFRALKEFDEGFISFRKGKKTTKDLSPEECTKIIATLKKKVKGNELFGKPRGDAFRSSLGAITQTYNDNDLYPTISEKAANLLYLIIKDHPFYDGNKRIGALLFVVFLTVNDYHLTARGETKITDRALTALALLIAESSPKEKPLLIALICKLLEN